MSRRKTALLHKPPEETAVRELEAAALGHSNRGHCEVAKVTHQETAPVSGTEAGEMRSVRRKAQLPRVCPLTTWPTAEKAVFSRT